MNLDWIDITLTQSDLFQMTQPITLLENDNMGNFYEVEKIILKLKYNSLPYTYAGNIFFKSGNERISTFQGDSISSSKNVVTISNTLLCKDLCSPLLEPNNNITMELDSIPPTEGDGTIEIRIYYILHEF
jgi:hypothetical protein